MDYQDGRKPRAPISGGSSLLVIFSVLCLVIFAMLAVATLEADRRVFDNMVESTEAYYMADNEAQEILSHLRAGTVDAGVESLGYGMYGYTVDMSDVMVLDCRVEIGIDGAYRILRWAVVRSVPWEGNFDTPVFVDDF